MNFSNFIKGRLFETVIWALLQSSKYIVQPFGIEYVLPIVREMLREEYHRTIIRNDNTQRLRKMPDFIVIDKEEGKLWYLEAKFRTNLSINDLANEINTEYKEWRPFVLTLFVKDEIRQWYREDTRLKHIKAFYIEEDVTGDFFLNNYKELWEVFTKLEEKRLEKTLSEKTLLKMAQEIENILF